jgi:hypothetical protein
LAAGPSGAPSLMSWQARDTGTPAADFVSLAPAVTQAEVRTVFRGFPTLRSNRCERQFYGMRHGASFNRRSCCHAWLDDWRGWMERFEALGLAVHVVIAERIK